MTAKQEAIKALEAMAETATKINIVSELRDEENKATIYTFNFDGQVYGTSICVAYDNTSIIFTPNDWQTNYGFDGTKDTLDTIYEYQWVAYMPELDMRFNSVLVINGLPRLL